jgi:hypothetical protein
MTPSDRFKLAAIIVILALAGLFAYRFFRQDNGISEKAFFYDLSEQKLFAGPRAKVPPIKGLKGPEEDAVRAVVISTNGNATDRSTWKIAYLEKYSPEAKRQLERAQAGGGPPELSRTEILSHRFVKRLNDPRWFPMDSAEAEHIVSEWAAPGPDGTSPLVCTP